MKRLLAVLLFFPVLVCAESQPWEIYYPMHRDDDGSQEYMLEFERWEACRMMVFNAGIATQALAIGLNPENLDLTKDEFLAMQRKTVQSMYDTSLEGVEGRMNQLILNIAEAHKEAWVVDQPNLSIHQDAWNQCIQMDLSLFE
ncbi:hypothetical protein [Vibrio stylophorae]|nr:hypothetical protein [Vibrio stylophorae]